MSEERITSPETMDTLGQILHKKRLETGLELEDIATDTKISAAVLRAMEGDDLERLPAPAFTRGLYTMYAQALGLDSQAILKRYNDMLAGTSSPKKDKKPNDIGALLQRPFVPFFSLIGFILLLLMLIGGTLSWYFSWSPASFLSKQLRELESTQPVSVQEQEIRTVTTKSQAFSSRDALSTTKEFPTKENSSIGDGPEHELDKVFEIKPHSTGINIDELTGAQNPQISMVLNLRADITLNDGIDSESETILQ